ncbi:hypothetical protein Cva_01638 [Caedimonas varicaedens]|uniref:Uncharacterized protein n=1 Tax=Caedimonas varicaedens TaxID=1629334 RepID=A0A0K8MFK0_9PROT|nr:hypothetical protein Cva_01638 [Caedimonas varicaedens]
MIALPWDVWLGISLMTLSAGMIAYKAYDYFFSPFMSISSALELMRRQLLNNYQEFNRQHFNISEKDYYEGLICFDLTEDQKLPLYGRLVFLNKPSTRITKIPKDSKPPYGNLTYDRLYTSIINKHKEPVYQDLRLKRRDLQQWIKNNTTVTS